MWRGSIGDSPICFEKKKSMKLWTLARPQFHAFMLYSQPQMKPQCGSPHEVRALSGVVCYALD